ncbi:MAG: quinone-dependent dihydroorotate dehydrogenase [Pseudomonadota bacterium]
MNLLFKLAQPALFSLDAEKAHGLTIAGLKAGIHPRFDGARDPRLAVTIGGTETGLVFPNPLGMAAGFDKHCEVPNALHALGFGHAEIGTVTPQPQPGNPKPRAFRLPRVKGVINRYGFNSDGHTVIRARLASLRANEITSPIGVNLGANKSSEDFAADYVTGLEAFAGLADYFTVNISSPNTPGLRSLQGQAPLSDLLNRVDAARPEANTKGGARPPVFLKIAPDLNEDELDDIATALLASQIDGLIVSNTTLSRAGTQGCVHRDQAGGLSGRPLFERSTIMLARMRKRLPTAFPLIGVGGISSAADALAKVEAGASLVQVYTGLVYEGPGLVKDILSAMSHHLDQTGADRITDLVGTKTDAWAGRAIPEA